MFLSVGLLLCLVPWIQCVIVEHCLKDGEDNTCPSADIITLPQLEEPEELAAMKLMFFLETSKRNYFRIRECCALESALSRAGDLDIMIVITSDHLDLSVNNATRQLIQTFGTQSRLKLRTVQLDSIFSDTALEEVFQSGRLAASPHPVVHLSDALRLALIHKYGGWYADLDVIFLDKIDGMTNTLGSDQVPRHTQQQYPDLLGGVMSNAIFHFERGHPVIKRSIEQFTHSFDGSWASGGPQLLSKAILNLCRVTEFSSNIREHCLAQAVDLNIVFPRVFYPVGWFDAPLLLDNFDEDFWRDFFKNSKTVHFYQSSKIGQRKVQKRRFYGRGFPGLLYLAEKYCPVSFLSERTF